MAGADEWTVEVSRWDLRAALCGGSSPPHTGPARQRLLNHALPFPQSAADQGF